MSDSNEVERLKSLRDRQLHARDPLAKQRQIQRQVSRKYREHVKKQNIFKNIWDLIPHSARGAMFGFGFGVLIFIIFNHLFSGKINPLITLLLITGPVLVGVLFGSSFDWRDKLRDI